MTPDRARCGRSLLAVLGLGVTFACSDDYRAPTSPVPNLAVQNAAQMTIDDHFIEIGERWPGFAGYYYEDGGIVLRTTDRGDVASLATLVRTELGKEEFGISIRDADYDFRELAGWRDQLREAARAGMRELDVDEVLNRVRIGVPDEDTRSEILEWLTVLNVPKAAVVVHVVPPQVSLIGLRDVHRPVPGGVQVQRTGGGSCTVMVNANTPAGPGFITNSHCTQTLFGPDGIEFHQPAAWNPIGFEVADPLPIPFGLFCPASLGLPCRFSDAAFISYDFGVQGYFGAIARTTGLGSRRLTTRIHAS